MPRYKGHRELSEQQRKFVDHYMVSYNGKEAAKLAGYSMTNTAAATHLLDKPQIQDEIRARSRAAQKRLEVDGDDVRNFWIRVIWDPRQPDEGGPTMEARMRAAIELGKLLGLYTNKIQVSGSLTLVDLLLAADKAVVAEQGTSH